MVTQPLPLRREWEAIMMIAVKFISTRKRVKTEVKVKVKVESFLEKSHAYLS
jgi:hypothetical protein